MSDEPALKLFRTQYVLDLIKQRDDLLEATGKLTRALQTLYALEHAIDKTEGPKT